MISGDQIAFAVGSNFLRNSWVKWAQTRLSRTLLIRCDAFWFQWVLFDTRAIKSSILERNSFRIGDIFVLL
jgi:hypothetical protein